MPEPKFSLDMMPEATSGSPVNSDGLVPISNFTDKISHTQITDVINRGIAYAIILAGLLSVVYLLYGGISFILSAGQEDKVKQATATIRHAIIGLIVTVLAVVAVSTVGRAMGVDIIKYINFSEIIDIIQGIGGKVGLSQL